MSSSLATTITGNVSAERHCSTSSVATMSHRAACEAMGSMANVVGPRVSRAPQITWLHQFHFRSSTRRNSLASPRRTR
jgi:hypothetical protein